MNKMSLTLTAEEWAFIVKCLRDLIDIGVNDETFKKADELADRIEETTQPN